MYVDVLARILRSFQDLQQTARLAVPDIDVVSCFVSSACRRRRSVTRSELARQRKGRTSDNELSVTREPASVPRRSIDEVLKFVLHVEVGYPWWSCRRKLEIGGFFVPGRGFGRGRGQGEVADAAVVLVDDESAAEGRRMNTGEGKEEKRKRYALTSRCS